MNLFYNPSLTGLNDLLDSFSFLKNYYNVIVDYDGEVMVEPSFVQSKSMLNKYKFYFRAFLWNKPLNSQQLNKNLLLLNQLYKNLIYCWEKDLKGCILFDEITKIQNLVYWEEMKTSVKRRGRERTMIIRQGKESVPEELVHVRR